MTIPVGTNIVFSNLIGMIQADRLLPGVQYATLDAMTRILETVPEGREAASVVRAELVRAASEERETILKEQAKMKSLFSELYDEPAPPSRPIEKIDYVPPQVVSLLKLSVAALEKAMERPTNEALEAYRRLERIAVISSTSQTMAAVLDPSTLDRARELGRARVESPAVRFLEKMVFPPSTSDQNGASRNGTVFLRDGKPVHLNQWDGLLATLSGHFGSVITRREWEGLFALPQKEYRIAAVDLRFNESGHLRVNGEIRQEQERVGFFSMSVPGVPARGTPWTVKVEAISIIHKRVGIGSQLLARLALFLHQKGVHSMRADAREEAGLFCVFNGFRIDKALYEEVVAEFAREMENKGQAIPGESIDRLLDRGANLADLAAFEWKGRRIGREFLQDLFTRRYLPVRFELSADKQSWLQLLSNLHRSEEGIRLAPLDWNALPAATHQLLYSGVRFIGGNVPDLMSSDRDHAAHLMERLNNWATMISMWMDFPESMLARLPPERKTELEEKRAAIQHTLDMIGTDDSSPLFARFADLMSPGQEGVTGDQSTNRAFAVAETVMRAMGKGWLEITPRLQEIFQELLSRTY